MAKSQKTEKSTDLIVFSMLRKHGYVDGAFNKLLKNVDVWTEKSSNKEINNYLSVASKNKKGNQGYPEYLIYDKKNNLVIVIENKRDVAKHYKAPLNKHISTYAVNGALWYAEHLKAGYDVIAIGISGTEHDDLLIDTYGWKKGSEVFNNLNIKELKPLNHYLNILNRSNTERNNKQAVINLNKKAKEINEFLRDILSVIEHERLYVLGAMLYALEDPVFRISYSHSNSSKDLVQLLYQTVERKVKGSNVREKQIIIDELKPVLTGLGNTDNEFTEKLYPNGTVLELLKNIDSLLFEYHKNREIDLMSTFFNVFLSYSTSGGSDLGIVLTPGHITKMFCDLANVNINSKILDICVGTGGFLTSAWKRIALDDGITSEEKEKFRLSNLFGIEKERNIYTIVALNMFLNKDGKSNLFWDDAFNLQEELVSLDCNVGFINPPYSDAIYSEISFVELMLDSLLPNSIGIAILPVNAVSSRTKKHSDIVSTKRKILAKHSLLASIQMPRMLFYPKGTETVVLVFKTGTPNCSETWLAKFDDGYELIKHQKTRTPSALSTKKYDALLSAYKNKEHTDFSFLKSMGEKDQWVYTVHEDVNKTDLQETVNEFISYLYMNGYV